MRKSINTSRKSGIAVSALVLALAGIMPAAGFAQGGAGGFTSTDAEEEGYWYSRYNLGNLVMRSGMGKVIKPDPKIIMKALAAVDADFDPARFKAGDDSYGDGDHARPPAHVAPIATVFRAGDPHYIARFDAPDFGTQRWDPAKMDRALTGLANGYTIQKEVEWARQFHVDDHFGKPTDDFGAYWRFVGMVMDLNAKMQAKSFFADMGAYDLSDGGAAAMLMAVSDLADLLAADRLPHSDVPNRYRDAATAEKLFAGADKLFHMVQKSNPRSIHDRALTIQALVWFSAKTPNRHHKGQALHMVAELAHELAGMHPKTATERAWYLRGLIEAKRTLGINDGSIRTVAAAFLDDFDMQKGGFASQSSYTIDDFGTIMGTLNALRIFETADVDADRVNEVFRVFWEEVMNKGGLQLSAPPIKVAKSPFEYEGEPETYFRYGPSQPVPPKAGGEFGIAPVFATAVAWKEGKWQVTDPMFDSAGAMHASNEMIWFHYDEINGFPQVDLSDSLR